VAHAFQALPGCSEDPALLLAAQPLGGGARAVATERGRVASVHVDSGSLKVSPLGQFEVDEARRTLFATTIPGSGCPAPGGRAAQPLGGGVAGGRTDDAAPAQAAAAGREDSAGVEAMEDDVEEEFSRRTLAELRDQEAADWRPVGQLQFCCELWFLSPLRWALPYMW
jgi:hypothetical protein